MAHVAEWKKEEVKDIKSLIDSHGVVGVVDLLNIPAKQMQQMRKSLIDKAKIKMSKKNLIDLAFKESDSKMNITELAPYMEGQPAIIFTDLNPFKLFKILDNSKTPAPAKVGAIATADIVVPAGDTGFEPGPFLGELQQIGIPAKIDKKKIVVSKDTVVVKVGEVVSKNVANALIRMNINPMEVGINLRAVYEDETIYTSDLLNIDGDKIIRDIKSAFQSALNLSINGSIPTKDTISPIINNAFNKAMSLAINATIVNDKTSETLISLANSRMLSLAYQLTNVENALDEELLNKVSRIPVTSTTTVSEEESNNNDDEEEEEESTEEDVTAGLGVLFG
ncbi:MAG: 50S ribosomal protein L10 [Methanobrevibacter sp.]|jgi:large subunit ribosomal protein L10|nr:50S ribosomal protein L10 [Candidatus Methanovirga aequatorialis]